MKLISSIGRLLVSLTHPEPSRDWFFALVLIFVVFFGLTFYAVYIFFAVQSGTLFVIGAGSGVPVSVTRGDIESVLDTYRTRSVNYAAHNLPAPPVVDPVK